LRIVFAITQGPFAGRQIVVDSGKTVRVGRSDPADYSIPADEHLSRVHFVVTNSHDRCVIADLGSRNGTLVNGNKVQECILCPDDIVAAGSTRFAVRFQNEPEMADVPAEQRADSEAPQLQLYAVLDAAQDDAVIEFLRTSTAEYQILYEGKSAEDLANCGPYLMKLPVESNLLSSLTAHGWAKNWGVFLKSSLGFTEVRKHLRHFLMVRTPEGKQVYFRFYDPRVMRMVVAGFNSEESASFFGPISSYLCEGADPSEIIRLWAGPTGVQTAIHECAADARALELARL
jgi:pSer/pThr/pTyr-binding forkhead associated (FHA) protein